MLVALCVGRYLLCAHFCPGPPLKSRMCFDAKDDLRDLVFNSLLSDASARQRWTFLGETSSFCAVAALAHRPHRPGRHGDRATREAGMSGWRSEAAALVSGHTGVAPLLTKTQPRGHQTKSLDAIQTLMGRPAGPLRQRQEDVKHQGRFYWTLLLDVSKFAKASIDADHQRASTCSKTRVLNPTLWD